MRQPFPVILNKQERMCVGLMSGTSLDGMDVAFCRISGRESVTLSLRYFETVPYTKEEQAGLQQLCGADTGRVDGVCLWNKRLGVRLGEAVRQAAARGGISMEQIDFVSSHGQTIHHMPAQGATLQIGELADIAAITGCLTVGDFRPSDMARGGQGAPLVPYADWVLCRSEAVHRVLINIGGIANLTALPAGGGLADVLAFDTGPGNVLSDHLVRWHTGGRLAYDPEGALAAGGRVDEEFVQAIAAEDDFFTQPPPKSTGREHYTQEYAQSLLAKGRRMGLPFPDILASVTDYTACALAHALRHFVPFRTQEVYLSGGGLHNRFLVSRLQQRMGLPVRSVDRFGMDGDAKEAVAFALLGDALLQGMANNVPRATGADTPVVMGKLVFPG